MIENYLTVLKQQQVFSLRGVSSRYLRNFVNENEVHDINNIIIVNENVMSSGLKFAVSDLGQNGKIKRKIFVMAKHLPDKCNALLSYNLLYNLKGITNCSFKEYHKNYMKFADEIEVSLINTSCDWSHFIIDHCLKTYFKTPKLLYMGDIIEINLEQYAKEIFHTSNKLMNIYENVYFKCNKIVFEGNEVGDGYFCVTDKSTMKQTTNIQSFIPKYIYDNSENWIPPLYPDALKNYFEDMKKAIYPFFNKKDCKFRPLFLLEGRKGSGKSLLVHCIASYFGMHTYTINNFDICANVYAQNETKLRKTLFGAKMAAPSVLEIKNFENFGKNNEGQYDERLINNFIIELANYFENNEFPVILLCCSNEKNIPLELKRVFLKTFEIKAPNEQDRENILQWILKNHNLQIKINVNNIANKTHGFLFEDLRALVHYAVIDFLQDNDNVDYSQLSEKYFFKAVDFMKSNYNESLGAPKVPKVKWSDVGGLNDVKEEIIKTIKLPLKHPQLLKQTGLRRSGILLFGPPGTGKTLIAKAVATECGLCFLSVKGPELLNMYVGQSEQNVREVFERARDASPCIIFFDELDSLAPNRGASGDSGGVMDRVVSQLLAEMDGLNRNSTVFIIGATNRPDLIDPALLRPGRFDKLLYVGSCSDRVSKIAVLQALTKKFKFSKHSVIDNIVDLCPENFSGADFYGICSNAWMSAVRRLLINIENESTKNTNCATLHDVVVTLDDFKFAIKNVKPSITQEDLNYFHKLKSDFK